MSIFTSLLPTVTPFSPTFTSVPLFVFTSALSDPIEISVFLGSVAGVVVSAGCSFTVVVSSSFFFSLLQAIITNKKELVNNLTNLVLMIKGLNKKSTIHGSKELFIAFCSLHPVLQFSHRFFYIHICQENTKQVHPL